MYWVFRLSQCVLFLLGTPIPKLEDLLDTDFENSNEDRARELQCMQSPAVFRSVEMRMAVL